MDREPTYPDDAPVGAPVGRAEAEKPVKAPASEPSATHESSRTRQIVAGAAIGIGSAALVAALLYANRSRKAGKDRK